VRVAHQRHQNLGRADGQGRIDLAVQPRVHQPQRAGERDGPQVGDGDIARHHAARQCGREPFMTDDIVAEIGLDHIIGLAYEVRRAKDGEDTFLQGDIDQCFGER
jgi:hypothetical protein